jgi:aerobic carbon-monoxide dehydrogenase medium subunit
MIAHEFEYSAPASLQEVLSLLESEGSKPLAGGMSLVPMMKLRLAAPGTLVDLRQVPELRRLRVEDGRLCIGAMVTHYELESTPLVRTACPLLAETAASIGDVQIRNRGTIGGAVAHADPAADYPAALLAMDTTVVLTGAGGERTVAIEDFFVDTFTTALEPGELITELRIPVEAAGTGTAYEKQAQSASGFAVVGVAVRVRLSAGQVVLARVGVTGLGPRAFRAAEVERRLQGTAGTVDDVRRAVAVIADGVDANADVHASAAYRSHLARVMCARALSTALLRAEAL